MEVHKRQPFSTRVSKQVGVWIEHIDSWIGLHRGYLFREITGLPRIIAVEQSNVLSLCTFKRRVACATKTAILCLR